MKRQQNRGYAIQTHVNRQKSLYYSKINQQKIKQRIKTQNNGRLKLMNKWQHLTNATTANIQSKLFHPDIYHRPQARKKYFHELIDTYMKKNPEKNINQVRKINELTNYYNSKFHIIKQNGHHAESNAHIESQQSSPTIINKSKRAHTAGYNRKVSSSINHSNSMENQKRELNLKLKYNLNQKQKLNINRYERKQKQFKTEHKIDYPQLSNKKPLKKISQKPNTLKLKNHPQILKKGNNFQEQMNNSFSSQSNSQLFHEQFDNQSKNQSQRKQKEKNIQIKNINTRLSTIQPKAQSKLYPIEKSFTLFSNSTIKSNAKTKFLPQNQFGLSKDNFNQTYNNFLESNSFQKQSFELQINSRLKIIGSKFDKKLWALSYSYQNILYKIFELVNKTEKINMQSLTTTNITSNNWNKNQIKKIKLKKFIEDGLAGKMAHTLLKIKQFGFTHMWQLVPKQQFKQYAITGQIYWSPSIKPLRQKLFKFIKKQLNINEKPQYFIQTTPEYLELFHNDCQQLKDIIIAVAKDLQKMSGVAINNKITLDNLYQLQQKSIKIGDWGCAAISRKIQVSGKQVIFRDEPIIKIQEEIESDVISSWLLSIQSLPPQVVQCLIQGNYSKIWNIQSCPQVWSLGIIIYQILTCIPVWMPFPSLVNHKIPKQGFLYDPQKRLTQVFDLQLKLPSAVNRWMRDEKDSKQFKSIHPQILILMKQMLQINPKLRPKPSQIIKRLQKS